MTAGPPQSPVTEGVRSLEVRWIFPGQLEAAVAGWFGRFPAGAESREDTYLLDPQLPGLSVKVRGGRALEVKAYRGSPGILEVAGRARGRLESWQKWSFPFSPLSPGSGDPPGWQPVRKRRRISRFSLASGQVVARRPGAGPAAAVRGGTHRGPRPRPGLVDPGIRGDRPRRPAPRRARGHRRARVRPSPCPAGWNPARMNPGPTRSGSASGQAPRVTPTPEGCPSATSSRGSRRHHGRASHLLTHGPVWAGTRPADPNVVRGRAAVSRPDSPGLDLARPGRSAAGRPARLAAAGGARWLRTTAVRSGAAAPHAPRRVRPAAARAGIAGRAAGRRQAGRGAAARHHRRGCHGSARRDGPDRRAGAPARQPARPGTGRLGVPAASPRRDGLPATSYPARPLHTFPDFPGRDFARGRGWGLPLPAPMRQPGPPGSSACSRSRVTACRLGERGSGPATDPAHQHRLRRGDRAAQPAA